MSTFCYICSPAITPLHGYRSDISSSNSSPQAGVILSSPSISLSRKPRLDTIITWSCNSLSNPKPSSNKRDLSYASMAPTSALQNQQLGTISTISSIPDGSRPLANFHPDIWGDYFLNYTAEDKMTRAYKEEKIEELKKQIRSELMTAPATTAASHEHLSLIDDIQRLGVGYHFEKEIEAALRHVYESYDDGKYHRDDGDDDDLYTISLRLLRQHGLDASSDVFHKFTDNKGTFKESLTDDWKGMLSLYEAANLAKLEGDGILNEALAFTTSHLSSLVAKSDENNHSINPLVPQIIHALKLPLLKHIPRLETRRYIPIYENDVSRNNKGLLTLAKLDFNLLQSMHRQELSELVRWWKELDAERKFPYARSRVVETYFCIYAMNFEPENQLSRKLLTKVLSVASIMDDTYDNYATFEELQHLTAAVQRWSFDCVDQLPESMKACYQLLLDTYQEIEGELARQGQSHLIDYSKRAMKQHLQAYFEEAKWLGQRRYPTMDEYMRSALVTTGYNLLPVTFLIGMRDGAVVNAETFNWLESNPKMLTAGSYIARLMDDIATHKFEQGREHIPSAVEIYMKENNVGEKEAKEELQVQIDKAWKIHNEELLQKPVPMTVLSLVLNLSRFMAITYMDGHDGHTNVGPRTKEIIRLSFIDPVPMTQ